MTINICLSVGSQLSAIVQIEQIQGVTQGTLRKSEGMVGVLEYPTLFFTMTWVISSLKTRSSWLNCALRDDEAVCWVSIGHYEAVAVSN